MHIAINTSHAHPNEYLMDFTHSQLKFHCIGIYIIKYALLTNSMEKSLVQCKMKMDSGELE
jgi:hypothetical protein